MRSFHPAIWLVPAVMLVIAVFPLPYGYYQLLRVVVFGCAALLSWKAYEDGGQRVDQGTLIFGSVALLMNPFLPVHLPKLFWIPLNILCCVVFLASLARSRRPQA
jgi:hypothetical protein